MTHDPSARRNPEAIPPASLHRILEREYPDIKRGMDDFLLQRGGVTGAILGLRGSITALRRHIYLEQEFLFPPLRAAGMTGQVFAMSFEHQALWRTADQMEEQLADGSAPDMQQQTCRMLIAELDQHISKEGPIVFGHADELLTPEEQATLRDFVESALLPPGWVCQEPPTS